MLHQLRKRLTYANVMSTLAVFLTLGTGTAYAANTVFSTDIVDGQVKTVDLGANAVKASKVADNTLTGIDINEFTLAGVDAAKVGGMSIKKINFQVPYGTAKRSVLNFPDKLEIYAECQDFGDRIDVTAVTGEANSYITATVTRAWLSDDTNNIVDLEQGIRSDWDPGDSFLIDDLLFKGSTLDRVARIDFFTQSGFVAHVDLVISSGYPRSDCGLTGVAIGG